MTEYHKDKVNCNDRYGAEVLSRRKRFLIFPEGSSLQLVFCVTYPAIFTIGDIFLWGNTAALAFELPQDPYSPFNHKADPLHRRIDTKTIYFTDYNGKIIHHQPYKRKFIVNPAFAKRSVDGSNAAHEYKIDRRELHASRHTREFLKRDQMENIGFHRHGRATLYRHVEGLLQGIGADGRMCLLNMLCEMGQSNTNNPQGPFLQEIMRVVFTLPKPSKPDDVDEEYDEAHSAKGSCEKLYPCAEN
ncbi:uncharacterized protein LOC112044669 [Bicyclus anynana]|uniref:Uncharacterized protein LOC112044669 n=1 Tax=Bicyclus anynana TaxID=110368 RepID=A0A6J1N0I4_BICAN|nr:uncharacterized protein LOC112044669 [Bicyclus anynana]